MNAKRFTPPLLLAKKHIEARAGFTMIEIIMVIVIIGILTALALPRFNAFYALKLNGAVKKVTSDIRYIQQIAVCRHTNSRVAFNIGNETYSAEEENPANSNTWTAITDPFTRAALTMNFNTDSQYRGINIVSANFGGTSTLRFNWQGVPQNSSGTNLNSDGSVVFSYQNNTNTIYVTLNTGRARIQ